MYNDNYSLEELVAELSQLLNEDIGTVSAGLAVFTRHDIQKIISAFNKKACTAKWTFA